MNRQFSTCNYGFCYFSPMKAVYCFGLNATDRGIQPWLAIFLIHISIDYPELASWKHLCWPVLKTSLSAPHPYLLTPSSNGWKQGVMIITVCPALSALPASAKQSVWRGGGEKEIRSVIQWILRNRAWGFLFLFKGIVISEAGLWKSKS